MKSKKFKFKNNYYYHPSYDLLKYVTSRKDAIAVRAWNFLLNFFVYGKENLFEHKTRRYKRWRYKLFKVGLIYKNSSNETWSLSSKGLELVNVWSSEIKVK